MIGAVPKWDAPRVRSGLSATRGRLAAAVAILLSALVGGWVVWLGGPAELLARYGSLAAWVSLLGHTAVAVTPASDFIPWGLSNGAVFGVLLGGVLNWASWTAGAALQWNLARRSTAGVDVDATLAKLPARLRTFPIHHPIVLIAGRWIPLGGFTVTVAAGALGVRFRRLLWCAALGSAPPAFLVAALGAGVFEAISAW